MSLVRAILRSDLTDLTVVSYGGPDVGLLCAPARCARSSPGSCRSTRSRSSRTTAGARQAARSRPPSGTRACCCSACRPRRGGCRSCRPAPGSAPTCWDACRPATVRRRTRRCCDGDRGARSSSRCRRSSSTSRSCTSTAPTGRQRGSSWARTLHGRPVRHGCEPARSSSCEQVVPTEELAEARRRLPHAAHLAHGRHRGDRGPGGRTSPSARPTTAATRRSRSATPRPAKSDEAWEAFRTDYLTCHRGRGRLPGRCAGPMSGQEEQLSTMSDATSTSADICAWPMAEAFRGDGERLCNPIGNLPMIGGRLARDLRARPGADRRLLHRWSTSQSPRVPPVGLPRRSDRAVTEARLEPVPQMFGAVAGQAPRDDGRHPDRPVRQPEHRRDRRLAPAAAQLLGFRGAPGNTINHTTSYWVPNHSPRVFVEAVDVVCGIGYDRMRELGPVASRFHEIRRVVSNLGVFDFETPDNTMRLRSVHPGVDRRRDRRGDRLRAGHPRRRRRDPAARPTTSSRRSDRSRPQGPAPARGARPVSEPDPHRGAATRRASCSASSCRSCRPAWAGCPGARSPRPPRGRRARHPGERHDDLPELRRRRSQGEGRTDRPFGVNLLPNQPDAPSAST
jgi:hypothetical protein